DNAITFNHSMGTKMYCEGKMEFEDLFFKTLSEISRYSYIANENFVGIHFFNQDNEIIIKARRVYYGH
ncbi:MAG: hypothetical protein RQ756_01925, partial [Flavobacteriaceae bacterium]|nr:hypothetical protein [Flavobacteriaceae bacterium]